MLSPCMLEGLDIKGCGAKDSGKHKHDVGSKNKSQHPASGPADRPPTPQQHQQRASAPGQQRHLGACKAGRDSKSAIAIVTPPISRTL